MFPLPREHYLFVRPGPSHQHIGGAAAAIYPELTYTGLLRSESVSASVLHDPTEMPDADRPSKPHEASPRFDNALALRRARRHWPARGDNMRRREILEQEVQIVAGFIPDSFKARGPRCVGIAAATSV
jgi:hypothetical protein